VSRAAVSPNLLFDRLDCLLRQFFTLVEFHEQHHAFVFLIFCHLTDYEAVRNPLNAVIVRNGGWPGKARVKDIVDLGGPEPDATRIPKESKDEGSAISTLRQQKKRQGFLTENSRIDSRIGYSQYPVTPAKHHKTSPVVHPRFR